MQQPKRYQTAGGTVMGIEARMEEIGNWRPTISQIRDTICAFMVVGTQMFDIDMPAMARANAPTQDDVEGIAGYCERAVRAGRLIDFGDWTNDVIKYGGNRGGPLYSRGVIGHPFRDPYLFVHTWEGATAVYLVNPLEPDRTGGDCECVELQPVRLKTDTVLMIGDRALLMPDASHEAGWKKYHCSAMPSIWRYLPGAEAMVNNGAPAVNAAAGNVLDPLVTALLILSTRGIPRETIAVSAKLQAARRKARKLPIPPYERVISAPYVTAIQNRLMRGRSLPRGGTHASPIAHVRMGHIRQYPNGRQAFVRDALVNFTDEARAAFATVGRSHYAVKQ